VIEFDQVLLSKEGMHRIPIKVASTSSYYQLDCLSGLINIRSNLLTDSSDLSTKFIFAGDFDSINDIDEMKMKFYNYVLNKFKVSIGSSIEMYKGSLIVNTALNTDSSTLKILFESMLKSSDSILPGFHLTSIQQFDERYLPISVNQELSSNALTAVTISVGGIVGVVIAGVFVIIVVSVLIKNRKYLKYKENKVGSQEQHQMEEQKENQIEDKNEKNTKDQILDCSLMKEQKDLHHMKSMDEVNEVSKPLKIENQIDSEKENSIEEQILDFNIMEEQVNYIPRQIDEVIEVRYQSGKKLKMPIAFKNLINLIYSETYLFIQISEINYEYLIFKKYFKSLNIKLFL